MSYKTILVHLDRADRASERIRIAAELAQAEGAHLIGAAMIGVSTLTFSHSRIEERDPAIAAHLGFLRERAVRFAADFEEAAQKSGVGSYEGRTVDGDAGYALCLQARYCDLVVIGQTDPNDRTPIVAPDFPEFVVLHAGRPVLIVPKDWRANAVGKKVLIAWNASQEATRAVTDSLPILRRAELVQVAVFNPDSDSEVHGEGAGDDIALFLARHGVNVEVLPARRASRVGSALLELAGEQGSDLLVMGGYGHTRFREFLMGGATRAVLADMRIPVLMSR
jgi:nucleotide-binding universal stress UspA family protein